MQEFWFYHLFLFYFGGPLALCAVKTDPSFLPPDLLLQTTILEPHYLLFATVSQQ